MQLRTSQNRPSSSRTRARLRPTDRTVPCSPLPRHCHFGRIACTLTRTPLTSQHRPRATSLQSSPPSTGIVFGRMWRICRIGRWCLIIQEREEEQGGWTGAKRWLWWRCVKLSRSVNHDRGMRTGCGPRGVDRERQELMSSVDLTGPIGGTCGSDTRWNSRGRCRIFASSLRRGNSGRQARRYTPTRMPRRRSDEMGMVIMPRVKVERARSGRRGNDLIKCYDTCSNSS